MITQAVTTQVATNQPVKEEWQVICMCALSILQDVCKRICNGDISMRELEDIKRRRVQMYKLCDAVATDDETGAVLSSEFLSANIDQRLKEYQHFQEYHQQLHNLMSQLSSVPVQGTDCAYNNNMYYS